jgi:transcription elongation factor GreA
LKDGKISNESPVGAAILGKKVGSIVNVEAPAGTIKYKIIKVDR